MITYNTAEQVYSRNHGSERLFKRPYCQTLNYTEGIFDFQKSMNAFWVVDNMVSYMPQILKAFEQNEYEFFVVEICVNKENKGHMEVFTEGYIGNDYNDCALILNKLTLSRQTGTYSNYGVTVTNQNTTKPIGN